MPKLYSADEKLEETPWGYIVVQTNCIQVFRKYAPSTLIAITLALASAINIMAIIHA